MISRRAFMAAVTAWVVAAPLAGRAQAPERPRRIGWLGGPTRQAAQPFIQPFLQGLRDLGWVEGRNLAIEWRFAGGKAERLPELVAELVQLRVELIVVPSTPTVLAAKKATSTIPLVSVAGNDPVGLGLVTSLARPGGNLTGLTASLGPEMAGKQLTLLKEAVPKFTLVAVLWNPATPGNVLALREAESTARALGVEIQPLEARRPQDLDGAFAAMSVKQAGALLILADVMFLTHRARLAKLAANHHLPVMYGYGEGGRLEDGILLAYGAKTVDNFRRAAAYVDKILKGASPAALPIERPTTFELIINAKTARALGVVIPQSLLARADQIIE
jgi:putative ABC transport system substrate-binding protein